MHPFPALSGIPQERHEPQCARRELRLPRARSCGARGRPVPVSPGLASHVPISPVRILTVLYIAPLRYARGGCRAMRRALLPCGNARRHATGEPQRDLRLSAMRLRDAPKRRCDGSGLPALCAWTRARARLQLSCAVWRSEPAREKLRQEHRLQPNQGRKRTNRPPTPTTKWQSCTWGKVRTSRATPVYVHPRPGPSA